MRVLREADEADSQHIDRAALGLEPCSPGRGTRSLVKPSSARRVSMNELISRGHAQRKVEQRRDNLGALMGIVTEESYHAGRGNRGERYEASLRWTVDPIGAFRLRYDLICLALLLYVAMYTPVQTAFMVDDTFDNIDTWLFTFCFDRIVDAVFFVDIGTPCTQRATACAPALCCQRSASLESAPRASFALLGAHRSIC